MGCLKLEHIEQRSLGVFSKKRESTREKRATPLFFTLDYFPYGKVLREYRNGQKERYLTTQHERDNETGLDYRGARYYDSDVARFLSLDPLATQFPDWSAYNYVFSNPIFYIDPTGRSPEEKKTGWTDNHVKLNEIFGDQQGFNDLISEQVYKDKASNPPEDEGNNNNDSQDNSQTQKVEYLVNNSNYTIYYKPENGDGIFPLAEHSVLYDPVDGVATFKYKNAVIKIPTGSAVTISPDGGADIHFYGFGVIVRAFGYGWIDESPDENWDLLFDKATEIGKSTY